MPLDALKTVSAAEEAAKNRKTEAAAAAKKRVAEARQEGERILNEARRQAAADREAAEKAYEEQIARALQENLALLDKKKSEICTLAESKLDSAAQRIVERIVNG